MNSVRLLVVSLFILCIFHTSVYGDDDNWNYQPERTLSFPEFDLPVFPYLGAVDASGNLWVISTAEESLYTAPRVNALFKAAPGETEFTLIELYGDQSAVRGPNGITAIGNDIYVSSKFKDANPYNPYTMILRYPDGDPQRVERYSAFDGNDDYGSWMMGIAATPDGLIYSGRTWLLTVHVFDFSDDAETFGNSLPAPGVDPDNPVEAGGKADPYFSDIIRKIALIPGGDYDNPETVFYSTRNSSMYEPERRTGGVSMWSGGSQRDPITYSSIRVTDPAAALLFDTRHPYGIAVDNDGLLYVCGTDPTRLWVKMFEVVDGFAFDIGELPSATTAELDLRDPQGAPFEAPSDIVFGNDFGTAYVLDQEAEKVFVFTRNIVSVEKPQTLPDRIVLFQNYPNPFNPSTVIEYELTGTEHVRLSVYNLLGQEIAVLVDGVQEGGLHRAVFHANNMPSGVYYYRLRTGERMLHKTMTIQK
jgi:hypothetical protein